MMFMTNELPRQLARCLGATRRARMHESWATTWRGRFDGAKGRERLARYEWARAAAALLAWGLS